MAAHSHENQLPKKGIRDDAQLGVWLGLISFTFLFAVFIVSNVYLRGWSPDVFTITLPASVQNLVNYNVILLLLSGVCTLAGGISYKKYKTGAAGALLGLAALASFGYLFLDWTLIQQYRALGPAAWTVYVTVQSFMAVLVAINVVLYLRAFFFMIKKNEAALNRFIPASTAVWMYTVIMGLFVFVQCDFIQVGQFAEWCGLKLQLLEK